MSAEPSEPRAPDEEPTPDESPRLPLVSRIALYYLLVFLAVPIAVAVVLSALGLTAPLAESAEDGTPPPLELVLLGQALMLPLVIGITLPWMRRIERRPLSALGVGWPGGTVQRGGRQLLGAALGAAALLTGWTAVVRILVERFEIGDLPIDETATTSSLLGLLLGFAVASCLEEWIFRGYIFSALREHLSWAHAAGITALLFAFLHFGNPEIGAAGMLNTFILGLVLAALREGSGSLWTAAAFHAAWNFLLGAILSLPVSGLATPRLFAVEIEGDAMWTGGDFGPEGSWILTGLLLLALGAFAQALPSDEESEQDGQEEQL